MAFDDAFGSGKEQLQQSLLEQYQPDDGQPFSVDPYVLTDRLSRKLAMRPSRDENIDFNVAPDEKAPDLSSFGTPVKGAAAPPPESDADLSSFGTPVASPDAAPSLTISRQAAALAKGIPHGAINAAGGVLKGAGALYDNGVPAQGETPQYDAMGDVTGMTNPATEAVPAKPLQDRKLYQAGQATQDFAQTVAPMSPEEKDSLGGRIGTGAGAIAAYGAATLAAGPLVGLSAAAGGMALDTYGSVFEAAKSAGKTDEEANSAAGKSALVAGVLGSLPLGAGKYAQGLIAKVAASSAAFTTLGEAQEALLQEIAKDYDPKAGYSLDAKRLIAELILGAGMGGLHHAFEDKPQQPGTPPPPPGAQPNPGAGAIPPGAGPGPNAGGFGQQQAPPGAGPQPGAKPGSPPPGSGTGKAGEAGYTMDPKMRSKMEDILRRVDPKADWRGMTDGELFDAVNEHMRDTSSTGHTAKPETPEEAKAREDTARTRDEDAELKGKFAWMTDANIAAMTPELREVWLGRARGGRPGTDKTSDAESTRKPTQPETAETAAKQPETDENIGRRDAPIKAETTQDVLNARPVEPKSAEQAQAENYQHAHVEIDHLGLTGKNSISIETGVGQERRGIAKDGKEWAIHMPVAYGRIKGTTGADGQPLDVFVGPQPKSPHVFVVDQHDPATGDFDEHKIMVGFPGPDAAIRAYADSHDDKGDKRIGHVVAMTPEEFQGWLKTDTTKPLKPAEGSKTHHDPEPSLESSVGHHTPEPPGEQAGATGGNPSQPIPNPFGTEMGGTGSVNPENSASPSSGEHKGVVGGGPQPATTEPVKAVVAGSASSTEAPVPSNGSPKETPTGGVGARHAGGSERTIPKTEKGSVQNSSRKQKNSKSIEPQNLLQFIASKGGLKPHPELEVMDAHKHVVEMGGFPYRRKLVRPDGMDLDRAREAAEEAGYFRGSGEGTSTVAEFLDAIDDGIRGQHRYPEGHEGTKAKAEQALEDERDQHEAAQAKELMDTVERAGGDHTAPEIKARALELMRTTDLSGPEAIETAFMQLVAEEKDVQAEYYDYYGNEVDDEIYAHAASGYGENLAREGSESHGREEAAAGEPGSDGKGAGEQGRSGRDDASRTEPDTKGDQPDTGSNAARAGDDAGAEDSAEAERPLHYDGLTAEIQAGDSDETVTVTLSRKGPWDFNDTWPAPDPERVAALAREGRYIVDETEGAPDVAQVVGMVDEGMNGIMSALSQVRAIDGMIADIRSGKTKLKKKQKPEDAIKALQAERATLGREAVDTAASYEDVFGKKAARAMMIEARRRLRGEDMQRDNGVDRSVPEPEQSKAHETVQRGRDDAKRINKKEAEREAKLRADEEKERDELDRKLSLLPTGIDAIVADYKATIDKFNDSMVSGKRNAILADRLDLLEIKANGGTSFGVATAESDAEKLRNAGSAPIGTVPKWGQRGVFALTIDGMDFIVTHDAGSGAAIYAADKDKPFPSDSGFRSMAGGTGVNPLGKSVEQYWKKVIAKTIADSTSSKKGKASGFKTPDAWYRLPDNYDDSGYPERVGDNWEPHNPLHKAAKEPPKAEPAPEPTTEAGADNKPQMVLPGAEKASDGAMAKRAAAAPLKPKVAQKAADDGLFGDGHRQADLLDAVAKAAKDAAAPAPPTPPAGHFAQFEGHPDEPEGARAQQFTLERGRKTGNEQLVIYDRKGNVVGDVEGSTNGVSFTPEIERRLLDPDSDLVAHHNHPKNRSFSATDIGVLAAPGLRTIWAHGHGGGVYRANLTPEARRVLPVDVRAAAKKLADYAYAAEKGVQQFGLAHYKASADPKRFDDDFGAAWHHLANEVLREAGIIEYETNFEPDPSIANLPNLSQVIKAAADVFRKDLFGDKGPPPAGRLDRRPDSVRHPGNVGVSFDRAEIAAAVNPGRSSNRSRGKDSGREAPGAGEGLAQPDNLFNTDPNSFDNSIADILRTRLLGRLGHWNATEFRAQLQDKFIRLKKAEESVGAPTSLSTYQAESLYYGRTGQRLETLNEHHIDPLIREMKARDIDVEKLDEFLYARHAPERNNKLGQGYQPGDQFYDAMADHSKVGASGMSTGEALGIIRAIRQAGKLSDYLAVAKMIDALNAKTRRTLFDGGLIDRDTFDALNAGYKYYVPLRGHTEGSEWMATGSGMNVRGKEFKQAFGRRSKASSPLAYSIMQAEMAVVRAEKNKVGNTFLQLVRANPDPARWTIDRPPLVKKVDPTTGLVTAIPDNLYAGRDNVFTTKVNGKDIHIALHGPDGLNLARALKNMGTANVHALIRAYSAVTHAMAKLATSINPEFMIPNFARDIGEAFINLQAQEQKAFVRNFVKHIPGAMKGSMLAIAGKTPAPGSSAARYVDAFDRFDKAGGRIRFFGIDDPDHIESNVNRKLKRLEGGPVNTLKDIGDKAAKALEIAGGGIENATRLAAFMAAEDAGMSTADAAMLARNLTVDFNKKGELGGAIGSLYMFANAGIQGQARMARALGHRRVWQAVGALAAAAALSTLYSIFASNTDGAGVPDYMKIPTWERDKNLIFMTGSSGYYMKVPLPYGFSPFAVIGSHAVSVAMGHEKPGSAASAIIDSIISAFNPLGEESMMAMDIVPSALRPAFHIGFNKNWTDKPLYPEQDKNRGNRPDSSQAFKSNSAFSKEAAKLLNDWSGGNSYKPGLIDVHPGSIDHILQAVGGGVGRFVKGIADSMYQNLSGGEWQPEKAPIVRRFVGKVGPEADAALYYEKRQESLDEKAGISAARKDIKSGTNVDEAKEYLAAPPNSRASIFKSADEQIKALRAQKLGETELRDKIRDVQNKARAKVQQLQPSQ